MRDTTPLVTPLAGTTVRLPYTIKPLHYIVEIEPDVTTNTFKGHVRMFLEVVKPTNVIAFHASDALFLDSISVVPSTAARHVAQRGPDDITYINLPTKLPAESNLTVTIRYHGPMSPIGSNGGLYPTPYTLPDGSVRYGFETMFQPIKARSVFPCFDEPDRKAVFTVSVVTDAGLTCLSNMEVASEEMLGSKKRTVFKSTPPMSTYLVVWVAGYFQKIESDAFHVPVRLWFPVDKDPKNAEYGLKATVDALKAHERNFDLAFPLPKLDMVAVPHHGGGMEHWGCVTCDETYVVHADNPSVMQKQIMSFLLTHELAHQWFGNIVTTKDWDNIWLNESFSDWAAAHAMAELFPETDRWAEMLAKGASESYEAGFTLDANIGSHAILDPNVPPGAAFDAIAYRKGLGLLHMLASDIGTDVFLDGVRFYLKQHSWGNATTEDLWRALSKVSGTDVEAKMDFWCRNVGFPLLTVEELDGRIRITQRRFLQNGDGVESKPWPLSVHVKTPKGLDVHPMTGSQLTIPVPDIYKVNAGEVGFYRVAYPAARLQKLQDHFHDGFLSEVDRVGIVGDLVTITMTGALGRQANLSRVLDFLLAVGKHEKGLYARREILGQIGSISAAFLFEPEVLAKLKSVALELAAGFLGDERLWIEPGDTDEEILHRALIFQNLKGTAEAQEYAVRSWKLLLDGDQDAINPNVGRTIFETVLQVEDMDVDDTWEKLWAIAHHGTHLDVRNIALRQDAFDALGSVTQPHLIKRLLDSVTPGKSAAADDSAPETPLYGARMARSRVLGSLAQTAPGAEATWAWLQANWTTLFNPHDNDMNPYMFIDTALRGLATQDHLDAVEAFFADKTTEATRMTVTQVLDRIRARARFAEAERGQVAARPAGMVPI